MTVSRLAEAGVAVAVQINLHLTQGILKISDAQILKTVDDWGTYQPKAAFVSPIASDNEGATQFHLTLLNCRYWVADIGTTSVHESLASLLRANAPENVLVEVFVRSVTDADTGSTQCIEGRIMQVLDYTPAGATFLVDQRERVNQRYIPANVLDRALFSTNTQKDRIPKESVGRAIPVPMGKALPIVPSFVSSTPDGWRRFLLDSGMSGPLFPAIEVQRTPTDSVFAWAEKIDGTGALSIEVSGQELAETIDAYVWVSAANAWGNVWDADRDFDPTPDAAGFYKLTIKRQPYIRVPLVCQRFIAAESSPGPAATAERAIDRKSGTWCTILPGETASWEVRNWTGGGHISANTDEGGAGLAAQNWEGNGYPAGLRMYSLLYFGPVIPNTGNIQYGITFPGAPTAFLFGASTTATIDSLESLGMAASKLLRVHHTIRLCDIGGGTGGANDGWASTKFSEGDFSAHADAGSGDPNFPLSRTGVRDARQFRATMKNNTEAPIFVASIGMDVAFVDTLVRGSEAWWNLQTRESRFAPVQINDMSGTLIEGGVGPGTFDPASTP